jgi:hypothetical protein
MLQVKHYIDYTANERYGLAVRFIGCLLATQSEVLIQVSINDTAVYSSQGMLGTSRQHTATSTVLVALHYMLHSTRSGNPHSGTNERLIGGCSVLPSLLV